MRARNRAQMVDELRDAYVEWRQSCLEVEDSYRLWGSGHGPNAAEAFARCAAALDHEGRAAESYAQVLRRVGAVVGTKNALVEDARGSESPAPWQ